MLPASNSVIPPHSNGIVTQEIRVANSLQGEKNIMLKLKIGYTHDGAIVSLFLLFFSLPYFSFSLFLFPFPNVNAVYLVFILVISSRCPSNSVR